MMLHIVIIALAAFISSVLTSFIGAWIDRHQQGLSLTKPTRSRCVCGDPLKSYQLIPVIYPLITRFKAPCGAKIPLRYPLGELFAAISVAGGTFILLQGSLLGIIIIFFGMMFPAMIVLSHHQKNKKAGP